MRNSLKRKFNKMCKRLNRRFDQSYDDVLCAFQLNSTCGTDKAFLSSAYDCALTKIKSTSSTTYKPYDILMYFSDYTDIALTRKYLEAYLLTNEDVLEADKIEELKRLIERYK